MNNTELITFLMLESQRLRALGTDAARFAAAQLDRAAQLVSFTGATSEEEFDDRIAANEASVAEQHYLHGFREGRLRGIDEAKAVIRHFQWSRN
jgi:hypothetical protein